MGKLSEITEIGDLAGQNGRQGIDLVDKNQITKWPWSEEERVAFLQRHGGRELWFVIVVSQMSDLVQVTETERIISHKTHTRGGQWLDKLRMISAGILSHGLS